jgi:hypothetical protein
VIHTVRERHPDFVFVAEAYWDREWDLQQLGFDFCYDKRLYDRLLHGTAEQVRLHLCADLTFQQRLVRFFENHDEPRAASLCARPRHEALAVAALTLPGARLVHDGQLTGRRLHVPVFLGRFADEPVDTELADFYRRLVGVVGDATLRSGEWELCDRWGWPDHPAWSGLVAWSWRGGSRWLIVVNLSDATAAGAVATGWDDLRGSECELWDPTTGERLRRSGDDVADGLYVELGPWRRHLWHVHAVEPVYPGRN